MANINDIKFAKFPIVKTVVQARTQPWWYSIDNVAPKTPQSKFINKIQFFTNEIDAFNYWKTFYPGSNNYTIEDYRKNWRQYKYQIWCTRVGNCNWLGGYDYNFNVLYCVVDKYRTPESNRLADDIRHYYIEWIKSVYTKSELRKMNHNHYVLVGDPYNWHQNVISSRRTWYFK